MSDKEGLDLILDRAQALLARISSHHAEIQRPPTDVRDERDGGMYAHWSQLVRDIIAQTAAIKLQGIYRPLQDLHKLVDRVTAMLALPATTPVEDVIDGVRVLLKRCQELEQKMVDFQEAHTYGTVSVRHVPHVTQTQIQHVFGPDEPRPSFVLERVEALVLGGWLEDATKNLGRVGEYMRANEERMSEDLFDELRRIADKVEQWAFSVKNGNMFPRSV